MKDAGARADRPEVVVDGAVEPDGTADPFDPRIEHRVGIVERGPFVVAVCAGCGWESFARRSRGLARAEGRDHELLHTVG